MSSSRDVSFFTQPFDWDPSLSEPSKCLNPATSWKVSIRWITRYRKYNAKCEPKIGKSICCCYHNGFCICITRTGSDQRRTKYFLPENPFKLKKFGRLCETCALWRVVSLLVGKKVIFVSLIFDLHICVGCLVRSHRPELKSRRSNVLQISTIFSMFFFLQNLHFNAPPN